MANKVFLSVVIPSYNEKVNLRKGVLDKIDHYLSKQKFSYEVIIVDDGSDDGSAEFAEKYARENKHFELIKSPHMGKAGAVTQGMLKAEGELRLFTDMDQATPIEEIEQFLPFFDDGFDIVIGSRKTSRKGSPLSRRIMSRSMIVLRKALVGMTDIEDTQCGFKMFTADASDKIFKRINALHHGFTKISGSNVTAGFDVEVLILATKMDYKIVEVPVEWYYVETRRVNPISDSINGLRDLVSISMSKHAGKYNS